TTGKAAAPGTAAPTPTIGVTSEPVAPAASGTSSAEALAPRVRPASRSIPAPAAEARCAVLCLRPRLLLRVLGAGVACRRLPAVPARGPLLPSAAVILVDVAVRARVRGVLRHAVVPGLRLPCVRVVGRRARIATVALRAGAGVHGAVNRAAARAG